MGRYRERLWVPLSWWLIPPAVAVSVWLAVQHAYGPRVSVPVTVVVVALTVAGLLTYGRVVVAVDGDAFAAGRARLPLWAAGAVDALDAAAARSARGPQADPSAFLVLRGYIAPMVRVAVDDPADPVPFWLVSTRHPTELAATLISARDAATARPDVPRHE
ncbi:MAG: DUF3093 domain-containing protein [Jiangellaceae bacterium]